MKLRSHEILSHPQVNYTPKPSSRLKKFFQGKHLFKKKLPISSNVNAQAGLFHQIPNYVRKSLLRYLLEVCYRLIRNIMLRNKINCSMFFYSFSWVLVKSFASMTINVDTTDYELWNRLIPLSLYVVYIKTTCLSQLKSVHFAIRLKNKRDKTMKTFKSLLFQCVVLFVSVFYFRKLSLHLQLLLHQRIFSRIHHHEMFVHHSWAFKHWKQKNNNIVVIHRNVHYVPSR